MAATLASLDGRISAPHEAMIPVTEEGFLRGDGAFEVLRVYGGRPFALDDHLRRLAGSAAGLRLEVDLTAVRADVEAVLAQVGPSDGLLRVALTRGGRRLVMAEELPAHPETVRLATVEYVPTRLLDGIKSLSYAANMLANRLAEEEGADQALLVTAHGRLLEAPTSSFFCAFGDGSLVTPPLSEHVLDSITRRRLLALVEVEERPLTRADVPKMREAFLASTTREVHPVAAIDGDALPETPGPRTREAAQAFRAHVASELA